MSTQIKLILPLIEGLSKEDFDASSGFVNAYIYDKNRPHLTSNLFLLYETKNRDYKKAKVMDKLQHLPSLYMWETIKINGEFYTLYSISLVGSKMKKLLNGIPSYDKNDIKSTLLFWGLNEEDVNKILFGEDPLLCTDFTSVPEEDYIIPDITTSYGYKESLAINKDSLAFFVKTVLPNIIKTTFRYFFFFRCFFFFSFFFPESFFLLKLSFFGIVILFRPVLLKKFIRFTRPISSDCSNQEGYPNGLIQECACPYSSLLKYAEYGPPSIGFYNVPYCLSEIIF